MSECINWELVIPNFQQGDVITSFGSYFKRQRDYDYIIDGGVNHYDILQTCACVRRKDSQQEGVYNQNGEQVVPEEFDKCELIIYNSVDFYVTAIKVKKKELYGLYDENGKMIVPVQYIDVYFRDNFIVVQDINKLFGAYSYDGRKIIDCKYTRIQVIGSLDEGLSCAIVGKNGVYGVKSQTEDDIVPVEFDYIKKILMDLWFIIMYQMNIILKVGIQKMARVIFLVYLKN